MIRPPPSDFDHGDDQEPIVSPSTVRWRVWKGRQERGEIIVPLPIDHELIEALLDEGIVDERGSRDRATLVRAILTVIANALATGRTR